jgi:hypothetical protein
VTRELRPCGTEPAYQRHIRRRETPCEACTAAHSKASRDRYAADTQHRAKAKGRAILRYRAMAQLAAEHRARFLEIYDALKAIDATGREQA